MTIQSAVQTIMHPGALAPIFFLGCLLGAIVFVAILRTALWMWPALLVQRTRLSPPEVVELPTSSFEEFPDPLQATASKVKVHEHVWKDYKYGEAPIAYVITAENCDCGAIRQYQGPAFGWIIIQDSANSSGGVSRETD